ncbi:hypothetical protein PF003_g7468 [Phytophthora fragariae]|nr:hypothetical protein PF003_g7468 [Phytophthora fragariae]
MLTNADISLLYKGIKHYDPEIDPREVLFQWISGFRPLPACALRGIFLPTSVYRRQ